MGYYRKVTSGVVTEHYAFFAGTSVYITEAASYNLSVNNSKTEGQMAGLGFTSITEAEYNTYVNDIEDFARVGSHPPAKP